MILSYSYLDLCHEPSSVLHMLGTKVVIVEIVENVQANLTWLQKNSNSTSLNSKSVNINMVQMQKVQ